MNDNNRPNSADLRDSGIVGTFEGREIHFIWDRNSDSRGVGFYAVNHDGKLEPINSSFLNQMGKAFQPLAVLF